MKLVYLRILAVLALLCVIFTWATHGAGAALALAFVQASALVHLSRNQHVLGANTLTISAFAENLFRARDTVARELTGFIPSVLINSGTDGVSVNGTITSLVTTQPTLNSSITPAMTVPAGDDQTITALTLQIAQAAAVRIPMTGEVWKKLGNTAGGQNTLDDLLAQGIRKIVNAVETHVGSVGYKASSRAVGTAGTTPFGSSHALIPQVHQILKDNGTPEDGQLTLVMSTSAGTNLRSLANFYKVSEAGTDALIRRGTLLDIDGFMLKESAGVASHTKGAGTGYDVDLTAGYVAGDTTIHLDGGTVNSTGIKAGDVVTFAGDTNKYVVGTGTTEVEADIVINNPGLRATLADTVEMTIGDSYTGNLAFHRNAIELVIRPPALPPGGDLAIDRMTLMDEKSGLVFEVSIYPGYKMQVLEIACVYQAKAWKSDFIATLLG